MMSARPTERVPGRAPERSLGTPREPEISAASIDADTSVGDLSVDSRSMWMWCLSCGTRLPYELDIFDLLCATCARLEALSLGAELPQIDPLHDPTFDAVWRRLL